MKFISLNEGISGREINSGLKDDEGYMWFGTYDGLNRFDGYNFKVFRHNPTDSNSLSNNSVWALLEDRKGNIWFGSHHI